MFIFAVKGDAAGRRALLRGEKDRPLGEGVAPLEGKSKSAFAYCCRKIYTTFCRSPPLRVGGAFSVDLRGTVKCDLSAPVPGGGGARSKSSAERFRPCSYLRMEFLALLALRFGHENIVLVGIRHRLSLCE